MAQTNLFQKPTFGIGVAICGIILSALIGLSTSFYYESAQERYKKELHETGQNVSNDVNEVGQRYADDLRSGKWNEDSFGNAMSDAQNAMDKGAEGVQAAQDKVASAIEIMKVITYIAMLIGLCSCAWGMVSVVKLKKIWGTPLTTASNMMLGAFAAFALATAVSFCSPIGNSFRVDVGKDLNNDLFERLAWMAKFLSIIGWILWFFASKKIYKLFPNYKNIYYSALSVMILFGCVILIGLLEEIFTFILFLAPFIYIVWGWMRVDKCEDKPVMATAPTPVAQSVEPSPQTAPVEAEASLPAEPSRQAAPVDAKASEPVEPVGEKRRSSTLVIIISIIAIAIIGIACAWFFVSASLLNTVKETTEVIEVVENNANDDNEEVVSQPTNVSASTTVSHLEEGEYILRGILAGKQIYASVYLNSYGVIKGAYCYGTVPSSNMLRLEGGYIKDTNQLEIREYYESNITGIWQLVYQAPNTLKGTMTNYKDKTYNMDLTISAGGDD